MEVETTVAEESIEDDVVQTVTVVTDNDMVMSQEDVRALIASGEIQVGLSDEVTVEVIETSPTGIS